jgi:hypothetical protein
MNPRPVWPGLHLQRFTTARFSPTAKAELLHEIDRSPRENAVTEPVPPHRRQGRLQPAGRPGARPLRQAWLAALAEDLADLHQRGADVLVVSSGAIALGRTVLGLPSGPLRLEESQAAAAVGQIALARTWAEALGITA